jgi:hypothetical protein
MPSTPPSSEVVHGQFAHGVYGHAFLMAVRRFAGGPDFVDGEFRPSGVLVLRHARQGRRWP